MFVAGCLPAYEPVYVQTDNVRTQANTQVQTWKLEVRNKKCRACIDERTHVRTNIWTHQHACGQTDRRTDWRTDGLKDGRTDGHSPSSKRAYKHMNVCIDERRHVRSDRQTDWRTDGRTDSHIRPHARAHAHTRTLAWLHIHDAFRYIRTDGQTYVHMFVRRQTPKYKHGS